MATPSPTTARQARPSARRAALAPLLGALLLLAAAGPAAAQTAAAGPAAAAASAAPAAPAALAAAQARHRRERAICLEGRSNQDQPTCLREADAALAEARRGGLDDGAAAYGANQRLRCARLPEDERLACLARMQGQGSSSGSVASGGLLRELVTRETPLPAAAPAPAPVPASAPASATR